MKSKEKKLGAMEMTIEELLKKTGGKVTMRIVCWVLVYAGMGLGLVMDHDLEGEDWTVTAYDEGENRAMEFNASNKFEASLLAGIEIITLGLKQGVLPDTETLRKMATMMDGNPAHILLDLPKGGITLDVANLATA